MKLDEIILKKKGILQYMCKNKKQEISYIEIATIFGKNTKWASELGRMLAIMFPDEFEYHRGILRYKKVCQDTT